MTSKLGIGFLIYSTVAIALAIYFAFATVQGDLGVLQRIEINAEISNLLETRDNLTSDVANFSNKTLRLSDHYLDLDLLDERARSVLGLIRANELVVR